MLDDVGCCCAANCKPNDTQLTTTHPAVPSGVVHHLARDERVASVTALTRRSRDDTTTLFDLSPAEAAKVKFAVVDYDALVADAAGSSIDTFAGHDIGMSCLGLYTSDAKDEAHFRHVEITTNVATATAMVAGGVDRFAYLSGMGAKKGGWMMFARVKADAEVRVCVTVQWLTPHCCCSWVH